ncbi:hypothetical protein ACLOJK_023303 [Asimina triloba]
MYLGCIGFFDAEFCCHNYAMYTDRVAEIDSDGPLRSKATLLFAGFLGRNDYEFESVDLGGPLETTMATMVGLWIASVDYRFGETNRWWVFWLLLDGQDLIKRWATLLLDDRPAPIFTYRPICCRPLLHLPVDGFQICMLMLPSVGSILEIQAARAVKDKDGLLSICLCRRCRRHGCLLLDGFYAMVALAGSESSAATAMIGDGEDGLEACRTKRGRLVDVVPAAQIVQPLLTGDEILVGGNVKKRPLVGRLGGGRRLSSMEGPDSTRRRRHSDRHRSSDRCVTKVAPDGSHGRLPLMVMER